MILKEYNMDIEIKTLKQAEEVIGGIANTSKMDTCSTSLSAFDCKTGSKLAMIKGSVCYNCYARKGTYRFKNVKKALSRRTALIKRKQWSKALTFIIQNKAKIKRSGLFRWHDSGDIQDQEHLDKIIEVVTDTPEIQHWLPTKESALVKKLDLKKLPSNLVVRLSGSMVNGKAPNFKWTSTVTTDPAKATCRAFETEGECAGCTKCYDPNVKNVVYLEH